MRWLLLRRVEGWESGSRRLSRETSVKGRHRPIQRLFDIAFGADEPPQTLSLPKVSADPILVDAQADVDISDASFDFVRSIRVFAITYQQRRNSDGDCNSWGTVHMGAIRELDGLDPGSAAGGGKAVEHSDDLACLLNSHGQVHARPPQQPPVEETSVRISVSTSPAIAPASLMVSLPSPRFH